MRVIFDAPGLEQMPEKLKQIKSGIDTARERAKNKAVRGMKTDAIKGSLALYFTKRAKVAPRIRVVLNRSMIDSTGRPLRSYYAKHRRNTRPGQKGGKPVFLRVMKSETGRHLASGNTRSAAFMATMPNGMTGIFRRNIASGKLQQVHSPGVVQMLGNPKVSAKILEGAVMRYHKELDRQIGRSLERVR